MMFESIGYAESSFRGRLVCVGGRPGLWSSVQDECHDALDAGFCKQGCGEGKCPATAGGGGTEKYGADGRVGEVLEANGFFQMVDMRGAREVLRAGWTMPREGIKQGQSADRGEVSGQLPVTLHFKVRCRGWHDQCRALFPTVLPSLQQADSSIEQTGGNDCHATAREFIQFLGPARIVRKGDSAGGELCGDSSFASAAFGPDFSGFQDHILLAKEAACLVDCTRGRA